jgi:hypothetical protein
LTYYTCILLEAFAHVSFLGKSCIVLAFNCCYLHLFSTLCISCIWGHKGMVSINIVYDICLKLSLDFTHHGKSEGTKLNDFSSFPKVSYYACLWIITSGSAYEKQKKDHLRKWSSDKWKFTLHQYISKKYLFLIAGFRICYGFLSITVVSTSDCGPLFCRNVSCTTYMRYGLGSTWDPCGGTHYVRPTHVSWFLCARIMSPLIPLTNQLQDILTV